MATPGNSNPIYRSPVPRGCEPGPWVAGLIAIPGPLPNVPSATTTCGLRNPLLPFSLTTTLLAAGCWLPRLPRTASSPALLACSPALGTQPLPPPECPAVSDDRHTPHGQPHPVRKYSIVAMLKPDVAYPFCSKSRPALNAPNRWNTVRCSRHPITASISRARGASGGPRQLLRRESLIADSSARTSLARRTFPEFLPTPSPPFPCSGWRPGNMPPLLLPPVSNPPRCAKKPPSCNPPARRFRPVICPFTRLSPPVGNSGRPLGHTGVGNLPCDYGNLKDLHIFLGSYLPREAKPASETPTRPHLTQQQDHPIADLRRACGRVPSRGPFECRLQPHPPGRQRSRVSDNSYYDNQTRSDRLACGGMQPPGGGG